MTSTTLNPITTKSMSTSHTTAIKYEPEPGSLPARVLDLFKRQPDEEFTSGDLALKFQVPSAKFVALLATALTHGVLAHERAGPGEGKIWRVGPHFGAWRRGAEAATSPTPQAAPEPAAKTASRLDVAKIEILSGIPIPEETAGRAFGSPYAALWDRMKKGDCVALPDRAAHGLAAYCKRHKAAYAMRRTAVGKKSVWRTA